MLLGAAAGLLGLVTFELAFMVFLLGLIPFRIFEWYITLRLFYGKSASFKDSVASMTALGIVWSFILDVPAIIGFIATGGFWIC